MERTGGSVPGGAERPARVPAATVVRASGLNLAARLTSGAAVLGLAVFSTNVLDTHGRGVYAILSTSAGIAMTIVTGGTVVLAADLIHGRHRAPVLHGASCAVALQAALLLFPAAAAISLLTSGVTLSALLCTAAVAVLVTYSNFEMALAQARGSVVRVSLADIGMAVFPLVLTAVAVAVVADPAVSTLMAAWAAGATVTASLQLADAVRTTGVTVLHAWRIAVSIVRRSLGVALANGTALLTSRIDVLVVAVVLSTSDAGIYSIPVALATALLLLSRSVLTATYRPIMTAPVDEVAGRLSSALRHSVIVVMAGGILSVPVVALTAGVVFGEAYSAIWQPYAILVPASACLCVAEMLRHFLITRLERQREIVITSVAMLIVNGVLAVVGAAAFGLLGAAASTTITYAGAAAALVAFSARALSVPMLTLAIPRRADLAPYWRVLRVVARRARSIGSVAAVRELGRRVPPALLAARSELMRGYWKTVAAVRVLGRGDPTVLGAVAGAAVSFGVCFAVVADATRSSAPATRRSAPHRAAEQPKSDPSAVTLALAPAAKLRVREALLAPIVTVAPRPAPKPPPVPSPGATEPQLAAPQTTAPPDTQAKPVEAKPAPRQRPAAKRRPAPKPAPKHAHGPDFDDTGPKSPPSGGSR